VNEELLAAICQNIGINLSGSQLASFSRYYLQLLEWNKKFNLTAIEEEKEVIVKHFYDSLLGSQYSGWSGAGSLIDLGTGAGFPGVPLKIVYPELQVTLVDSLQKRIGFLDYLIAELGLTGIKAVHGRAEDLGQNKSFRESYNYVVSRAVAKMPVLCELCLPMLQPGGIFLAYKGPEGQEELQKAEKALRVLGGREKETIKCQLPLAGGERLIIAIEKIHSAPKEYPRKAGTPAKKPL